MLDLSGMGAEAKIDETEAARMLDDDVSVREVAHRFGVSTQAIYLAIQQGRLPRRRSSQSMTGDGGTSATPRVENTKETV